ncbi:MAG: hypothetical protein ACC652_13880, partial [Acidimicrobiales bacterium]
MKTTAPELMKKPDGSVMVEAASADAALEAVRAELGADARVLAATRETRGGVGGFFAKEVFVVHAARSAAEPVGLPPDLTRPSVTTPASTRSSPSTSAPASETSSSGLTELLKRVESGADGTEVTFGDMLRTQIANGEIRPEDLILARSGIADETIIDLTDDSGPSLAEREVAAIEARRRRAVRRQRQARLRAENDTAKQSSPGTKSVVTPSESIAPAQETEPAVPDNRSWVPPVRVRETVTLTEGSHLGQPTGSAAGAGAVDWSLDRLAAIGIPFSFVQDLVGIDSKDDLAWICAIAHKFEQYCRPLPMRESVHVGPRAAELATVLGVPCVTFPDNPPYGGSVCLRMDDDGAHRAWLTRV